MLEVSGERVEAVVAVGDGGHGVLVLCVCVRVVCLWRMEKIGKWGLSVIGTVGAIYPPG